MSFKQKEDYNGKVADVINLANEPTTDTKGMITVLSHGNIKAYMGGKNSLKVGVNYQNDRPDFSDLGIGLD